MLERNRMIPTRYSTPFAARILGLSIESFEKIGLVGEPYPRTHRRFNRQVLEMALGRKITEQDVEQASAAHEKRKAVWRKYNHNRRKNGKTV
jgi:hypothetical protein